MQSRIPFKMMATRRSTATKCGSHSTGATGSFAIDSRINCDSGFGPFWKLKWNKGFYHCNYLYIPYTMILCHCPLPSSFVDNWNCRRNYLIDFDQITCPKLTYVNSVRSVDARIMQHCKTGAKIDNSSWNALPKPRPWSQCNTNVSLPNILQIYQVYLYIVIQYGCACVSDVRA